MAADQWFFTTSTPVVRLNFDPVIGVNELNSQVTSASIYPNPTSTSSTVEFNLATSSEVSMTVNDLSGKVVSERNLGQLNAGANSSIINTEAFTNGIYYVTVKSNGSAVTKKLIKN
ncbi:MAG: T9SS C-terminal target domain-containing protein [Flavobacteriales bacterium]|nr:T9SS C-terminal target domain-containing protein [Flavobacteriales bacterium]